MPLLDIATVQPFFQSNLGTLRAQSTVHSILPNKFTCGEASKFAFAWKSFPIPYRVYYNTRGPEIRRSKLLIKAVATCEPKTKHWTTDGKEGRNVLYPTGDSPPLTNQIPSSSGDPTEVDDREKLRRMRISKANKGNTPWNKGRKHSEETRQRIRERTKIAMQDPKVKMKLINLGHAQSKATRMKIGIGVQIGWQRRREKLMLQETCHFEWQNLIADASRIGYDGEEKLEWDSYKVLDEQLEQEWLESVELRKSMPRQKGSKRAPKSPEQRKKISAAISAKWADPGYRDRVVSALAKYHGIPDGLERKPRRRSSGDTKTGKGRNEKKTSSDKLNSLGNSSSTQNPRSRLKKSNAPRFKDPLANSKLEMIKNIRAQRVAAETKKSEAIKQAKLMIAEAEKAAQALELVAITSPHARASLMETRKLIAQAIQSIESIDGEHVTTLDQNSNNTTHAYPGIVNNIADPDIDARNEGLNGAVDKVKVNGNHSVTFTSYEDFNFDFDGFSLQNLLDEDDEELNGYDLPSLDLDNLIYHVAPPNQNGKIKVNGHKTQHTAEESHAYSKNKTKRWVCGRLVDEQEGLSSR